MAQPNSITTPPDRAPDAKPGPTLIPVRSLRFRPDVGIDKVPGKAHGGSSVTATPPAPSDFWTIALDPRLRCFIVSHYKPSPDLARRPDESVCYPESVVASWVPA